MQSEPGVAYPWQHWKLLYFFDLHLLQQQSKGKNCCVSMATIATRTLHNVKYVRRLFCYNIYVLLHSNDVLLRRLIQSQSGTFLSVIMSWKLRRFCNLNHLSNRHFHTSIFSFLLTEYKVFTVTQPIFSLFRLPVSTQTHLFSLFY